MGAFELNPSTTRNETRNDTRHEIHSAEEHDSRRLREECVIALKVYDSCRQQDCLTNLGPAIAAEDIDVEITVGSECGRYEIDEGDIIEPPPRTASVNIDNVRVEKIKIINKKPNPFKAGFWDIHIQYVFKYRLTFRRADGRDIFSIEARSVHDKHLTLFGSTGSDLAFSTDLFKSFYGDNTVDDEDTGDNTIESKPFVMVEAKAVGLSAEMRSRPNSCRRREPCVEDITPLRGRDSFNEDDSDIFVTIGLFTVIKVFRIVTLSVQSKGFCEPEECDDIGDLSPCDFFDKLDFPFDIFSPPQKPEFFAGIGGGGPKGC